MQKPPTAWRQLPAYHRDILTTLYQDGPMTGADIHGVIGQVDGRKRYEKIYAELEQMEAAELVTSKANDEDSRKQDWRIAPKGDLLVEKTQEMWVSL